MTDDVKKKVDDVVKRTTEPHTQDDSGPVGPTPPTPPKKPPVVGDGEG